jgi:hypothetical protein
VKQVVENADLVEIADASFAGEKVEFGYDAFFETELAVDRFAQGWRDRFAVRQPPRQKEDKLPFEFPDDRLVHSKKLRCSRC